LVLTLSQHQSFISPATNPGLPISFFLVLSTRTSVLAVSCLSFFKRVHAIHFFYNTQNGIR
jgi:hypothetical protein